MSHLHPPPGWPQRVRRQIPFVPAIDDDRIEVYLDDAKEAYHINLRSLEVYAADAGRWRAPGWVQLPSRVRARVWALHAERLTA